MTTLREKAEKMLDEGMDAARMLVRQHVGLAGVHGDPGSIYSFDLTREARAIEVDLDAVSDRIRGFLAMSAMGPTEEERAAQRQLDLDNAIAAGRRLVAAGATSVSVGDTTTDITPPRSPAIRGDDPRITQAIDEIQGRLGAEQIDIFTTDAHPDDLVIRWGGRRGSLPIDLALGTLEACADGCGPEAVWGALLEAERLADAADVVPDSEAEPELVAVETPALEPEPTNLDDVEAELDRLGLGADEVADLGRHCTGAVVIRLADEQPIVRPRSIVLAQLRALPDRVGFEAVRAALCGQDEPRMAANGTNARRAMVDHVSKTGAHVFCRTEHVSRAGAYQGSYGSVRTFPREDVLEVLDAAPKEEPGRAAGEAPAPRKRRGSKAKAAATAEGA